jgi:hypothetical protein
MINIPHNGEMKKMSEQDNTKRPHYLRQQPTVLSGVVGLSLLSVFSITLTPVIIGMKYLKTIFDSATSPDPNEAEGHNKNIPQFNPTEFHIIYADANIVCVTEDSIEKVIKPLCDEYQINLDGMFQNHAPMKGQKVVGLHIDRFKGLMARIAEIASSQDSKIATDEISQKMQDEFNQATRRATTQSPFKFPEQILE